MSYNVDRIVDVTTTTTPRGLATPNFAIPMLMGVATDNTGTTMPLSTYLDFSSPAEVAVYYPVGTETYKAAVGYLGGSPSSNSMSIFKRDTLDTTWTESLNKARDLVWRYGLMLTKDIYDEVTAGYPILLEIAKWAEDQKDPTIFINCQSSTANVTAIRTKAAGNICELLNTATYTRTYTLANASGDDTSNYAAVRLFKWYADVNYDAFDSAITGEYRSLAGVSGESLTTTEYNNMEDPTINCAFYSIVTAPGSTAGGASLNVKNATGNFLDNIINLDSFTNKLIVDIYNVLIQYPKTPYSPAGFDTIINACKQVGEQYISNNYLGPRYYTKSNGEVALTNGYEVLTEANQILDASATERTARKSPPILMQIYTAGAIHIVSVNVGVF